MSSIEEQLKVSELMRLQSEKLAKAMKALKRIKRCRVSHVDPQLALADADFIASEALREIGDHGKNPEDL